MKLDPFAGQIPTPSNGIDKVFSHDGNHFQTPKRKPPQQGQDYLRSSPWQTTNPKQVSLLTWNFTGVHTGFIIIFWTIPIPQNPIVDEPWYSCGSPLRYFYPTLSDGRGVVFKLFWGVTIGYPTLSDGYPTQTLIHPRLARFTPLRSDSPGVEK